MNNTCVCCGCEVPEGRFVCTACELRAESGAGYKDIMSTGKTENAGLESTDNNGKQQIP